MVCGNSSGAKMTAAAQAIGASKKLRVFLYNFTSTHALQNL
jgi:hypothetical protein